VEFYDYFYGEFYVHSIYGKFYVHSMVVSMLIYGPFNGHSVVIPRS
jgi:hypothetical protein